MTRLALTTAAAATLTVALAAQRAPAPAPIHVAPDVIALACAPKAVYEMPGRPLRITGGQDDVVRRIYSPGDLVTINAGTNNGIEVGQEHFVRRVLTEGGRNVSYASPGNIRTTGWIRS